MASSPQYDLDNLKRKLDAGADPGDHTVFLRCWAVSGLYLTAQWRRGITAPLVPGIMPVSNFAQAAKFSAICGTTVPDWLAAMFERNGGRSGSPPQWFAAVVAAEQVRLLQANGVDEFHFYTLNRPELTYAIAHILGVRPVTLEDKPS